MLDTHTIKKTFVRQHDSSDCGVACLRSVIRFYQGDESVEVLREISGTSKQGTSLLGLYEAAQKLGFDAEGCQATIADLIEHNLPVILHVLVEGNQEHYIIWYGYELTSSVADHGGRETIAHRHIIGDPAKGVVTLEDGALADIWQSGKCLTLTPNGQFVKSDDQNRRKKDWFLSLIYEDAGKLAAGAALGLVMAMLGMVMAVFSQRLIDDILPSHNLVKLISGTILVAFLILVRIGMEMLRSYILLRQSYQFNNRITTRFYDNILHLPKLFFDNRKIGDIIARMNDTSRIQRVISQLAGQVLVDVLVVLVSLGFLFFYSWQVGLGLLVCLPVYFMLLYRFHLPVEQRQTQVMTNYALSESNLISTIQGVRSIKSLNRQSIFSRINQGIYGIYQDAMLALGMVQLRLNLYASLSGAAILIGILSFSSYQVLQGNLKTGELMAIIGMGSSLLPSVASLALLIIPVNEARVAFDRMFAFTGLASEASGEVNANEKYSFQNLKIVDLTYRFPGGKTILSKINLELKKGEIIGVIGESGCGKSTLVQLIERLYKHETGSILLNRHFELSDFPLSAWRDNIACVPQEVHIFNGTVLDNVLLGIEQSADELTEFFSQEPFISFINTLPQGLGTLVGEEGVNLSGGQKQWVGLMRAFYNRPQLLLLDESTSAMDAYSEGQILKLLQKCRPEMGIIYVSHRLHTLPKICDRIYILEKGNLAACGSHRELLITDNMYSRFWNDLAAEVV